MPRGLGARLDAARGKHERVDERFRAAAALFREFGLVFHLAVTQLEHGEWLAGQSRADEAEPLLAEARETFERLQATPWLERAAQRYPPGETRSRGRDPLTRRRCARRFRQLILLRGLR